MYKYIIETLLINTLLRKEISAQRLIIRDVADGPSTNVIAIHIYQI